MDDDNDIEVLLRRHSPRVPTTVDVTRIRNVVARRRRRRAASVAAACAAVAMVGIFVTTNGPSDDDVVDVAATATNSSGGDATPTSATATTADPTVTTQGATPQGAAATTSTQPQSDGPDTTPDTATTVPSPTTAPTVTSTTQGSGGDPYDRIAPLPAWQTSRGYPSVPSPPYRLEGDPFMDHGDDLLDAKGCVWLVNEAGDTISVLWPPRWTVRFHHDGDGSPTIEIRDELGMTEATNSTAVAIAGGPTDQAFSHCHVSELAYEVVMIGRSGG